MKLFIQFFFTLYLTVFLIGGGRVCACEALSWVGIDVHHHHDDDGHHHHDCCDLVEPFDTLLPEVIRISDGDEKAAAGLPADRLFDNFETRSVAFDTPSNRCMHPPPPLIAACGNTYSLALLQRYLV